MKAKLLVGLLTVALGGLTSCSNILEENGVINNVAESGMGELRINLSTDASVNVSTKATENLSSFYETLKDDFIVTLTAPTDVTVTDLPTNQKFSEISETTYTLPIASGYTLKANYGEMTSDFGWNCPVFEGTNEAIEVKSGAITTASVTCSLKNAIINVDLTQLDPKVTVNSLYAYSGSSDDTKFYLKGTGIEEGKALDTDTVYVKSGVSAKLVLEGTFEQEGSSKPIVFKTPAQPIKADESEVTVGKTKYNVTYKLNTTNGQITIAINIDGEVTLVPINVAVNPYDSTTQENQSSDGE